MILDVNGNPGIEEISNGDPSTVLKVIGLVVFAGGSALLDLLLLMVVNVPCIHVFRELQKTMADEGATELLNKMKEENRILMGFSILKMIFICSQVGLRQMLTILQR